MVRKGSPVRVRQRAFPLPEQGKHHHDPHGEASDYTAGTPRRAEPPARDDPFRGEAWDGIPAGLIGVALIILAALAWRAWHPTTAHAHTVRPATCDAVAALYPTPTQRRVHAATCRRLAARHARAHHCQRADLTPYAAIDCLWPAHERSTAKAVARCESTAHVSNAAARSATPPLGRWARNGEHWGVFQLNADARATYGAYRIGADAREQVASALRMRRARGWGPWSCA